MADPKKKTDAPAAPAIVPPAPTVPVAPRAAAVEAPYSATAIATSPAHVALVAEVRKMLAVLPRDLATAPWPSPAKYSEYVARRAAIEAHLVELG